MEKETKEATSFYTGAKILLPAVGSLVGSIITIVWFAAGLNTSITLLSEKLEAEKAARIALEIEVKLNSERLGEQAVVLGRFEEKLNNVEKTGNETLKLLRDYTGRH
jgi:hypothetical protein